MPTQQMRKLRQRVVAGPGPQLGFSAGCDLLDFRLQVLSTGTSQVLWIQSSGGCDWGLCFTVCEMGVISIDISIVCAQQPSGNEKM